MLPSADTEGWKIAVVESDRFGGACLNRGCIPSKMFVYAADVAEKVLHSSRPMHSGEHRPAGAAQHTCGLVGGEPAEIGEDHAHPGGVWELVQRVDDECPVERGDREVLHRPSGAVPVGFLAEVFQRTASGASEVHPPAVHQDRDQPRAHVAATPTVEPGECSQAGVLEEIFGMVWIADQSSGDVVQCREVRLDRRHEVVLIGGSDLTYSLVLHHRGRRPRWVDCRGREPGASAPAFPAVSRSTSVDATDCPSVAR